VGVAGMDRAMSLMRLRAARPHVALGCHVGACRRRWPGHPNRSAARNDDDGAKRKQTHRQKPDKTIP
jgi:hypothetical protein